MIVKHELTIDLLQCGKRTFIDAVQDDKYSRWLAVTLLAGSAAWKPPDGVEVLIRYVKPNGYGGEYTQLPDGSRAWYLSVNVLTLMLAPQVLTEPGLVELDVLFIDGTSEVSTFKLLINVHPSVRTDLAQSENYRYISGYLPMPDTCQAGEFLRVAAVNSNGSVAETDTVDMEEYLSTYTFLPDVTEADIGKVLRVNSSCIWEPQEFTVFIPISQEAYEAQAAAGTLKEDILYMIVGDAP